MPTASPEFVRWLRAAAPYLHAFRGRTFVVGFGGEVVQERRLASLAADFRLLAGLGVRLVLVHGARPQVEALLHARQLPDRLVGGLRVTGAEALECVKQAAGSLRVEIEAQLSTGAGSGLRVTGGNYVSARPRGVIDGVDLAFTGEVRRVHADAMRPRLEAGEVLLLSPLGWSPTGEVFNLAMEEVAAAAAVALGADKLVLLGEPGALADADAGLLRELTASDTERLLEDRALPDEARAHLRSALSACRAGVDRVHLLSRRQDGALLQEFFTREGVGTMIARDPLERLRLAGIEDVGGLLALLSPLEEDGTLVRRSRERLEREISRFRVLEHDGMVVGCAALYPFAEDGTGELAALAVHPDYRNAGAGDRLLRHIRQEAAAAGLQRLFVLTTRATHWFLERGFVESAPEALPASRQALYNYQRNSHVLLLQVAAGTTGADLPAAGDRG